MKMLSDSVGWKFGMVHHILLSSPNMCSDARHDSNDRAKPNLTIGLPFIWTLTRVRHIASVIFKNVKT